MEPDLRCYYHPEREATSQCDRCGDYLCDECVRSLGGEQLCSKCYDGYFRRWPLSGWLGEIVENAGLPFRRLVMLILCLLAALLLVWAAVVISEWLAPFFL